MNKYTSKHYTAEEINGNIIPVNIIVVDKKNNKLIKKIIL